MTDKARFWDKIADKYAARPVSDEAAYERKIEVTQGYLKPGMRVLEFGCGTGTTAVRHAPLVGRIHAVDISERMLEIGRGRARDAGVTNIDFERSDFGGFEAEDASFDVVMGHSILHLLPDRDAAIAKVRRLLKPQGVFVSSTVCIADMGVWRLLGLVAPLGAAVGLLPPLKSFSEGALVDSITRAGFTIEHHWRPKPRAGVFIVARRAD